jgi:hypothetical protein
MEIARLERVGQKDDRQCASGLLAAHSFKRIDLLHVGQAVENEDVWQ